MDDYARIDNGLAKSQTDIGESSNLAQIAQTYACNFPDQKYIDYVCILSVLAQISIDNAKRRFDVDLTKEIQLIKKDMNISEHKYPSFWSIIKKDFNKRNINPFLRCPMNYLFDLDLSQFHPDTSTLPMSHFFRKFELSVDRRKCKKVEDLINSYSIDLLAYNISDDENGRDSNYLLLRSDFDDLIANIRKTYISSSYIGLFSWLIDRAFLITPQTKGKSFKIRSMIHKNKAILLKTLYEVNRTSLLKCLSNNS